MMSDSGTDLSTVQVLLDNLKDDSIHQLITQNGYEQEALEFLNSICNDNLYDLTQPDSVTLGLGELENQENMLKSQIQKKTVNNIDVILSAHNTLDKELTKFNKEFAHETQELYLKATDEDWVIRAANQHLESALAASASASAQHQHQQSQAEGSDASIILQNIDRLMDILELPALTAACVKQGHFSESLEVSSHAKRLSIRYSDIGIINKIGEDIKLEINNMLVGLIRLLKTDLKQSSILKIMTYLKRINVFNESASTSSSSSSYTDGSKDKELKLIYLQARFQYVLNELAILTPIKKSNIEKFLKRNIEVIREHCFSTIVVFENIFNSQDITLVREFVLAVIHKLTEILRENLPLITDKSTKENLLLQLCYCSNSLNRIGFEFSAVLLAELSPTNIITVQEWLTVTQRRKKFSF